MLKNFKFKFPLILLIVCLSLAGCLRIKARVGGNPTATTQPLVMATNEAAAPTMYWPTEDWRSSMPEEQGMDGESLARMVAYIKQHSLNLHSLLVIRNGYLVSETYFGSYAQERQHELYSCTKSFVATLVGIAIQQGKIGGIEQKVLDFFPAMTYENSDARKQAMTLEDLLTMTSGLDWQEGNPAYWALSQSNDWVKHMLDLPMREAPGEQFNYCSGCSHVLSGIIWQETGATTQKFAESNLFIWLGIEDYFWSVDARGNAVGGWGLQITPRQMAKLGYLYLHKGNWDGQQVVPAAWVEQATQAHVNTGQVDVEYGYQWWIFPDLGGYAALGLGGQMIFVAPELDLVVVTTAEMDGHAEILNLLKQYILPAAK
jgi:CubicO group peptidase (beta-lactamase class C family)